MLKFKDCQGCEDDPDVSDLIYNEDVILYGEKIDIVSSNDIYQYSNLLILRVLKVSQVIIFVIIKGI